MKWKKSFEIGDNWVRKTDYLNGLSVFALIKRSLRKKINGIFRFEFFFIKTRGFVHLEKFFAKKSLINASYYEIPFDLPRKKWQKSNKLITMNQTVGIHFITSNSLIKLSKKRQNANKLICRFQKTQHSSTWEYKYIFFGI